MKTYILLSLVTFLVLVQGAHIAHAGTPVFSQVSARGRVLPKVTTAPDGRIVLTFAEREGTKARYFVSVSDNKGITFSTPKQVVLAEFGAAILQRQPYVVMDGRGVMHVLVEKMITGAGNALHHQSSTDLGETWSTPVRISAEPPARPQDFASIAIDKQNNLYVSFISVLATMPDSYTHIFLVRSTDGGLTWSKEERVDRFTLGGCCECCNQNLTIADNGDVVVAFRSNIANRRDVHIARSTNNGVTFSTPLLIQSETWMIGGCPGTGPSIKCDSRGTLHITWRDARNESSPGSCFYAALPSGSMNTPMNMLINSPIGTDGEYPIVATSTSGDSVGIVWHGTDGVFFAQRSMLPSRTMLSSQDLQNPCVSAVWHGSGFLAIWQEHVSGANDIVSFRTDITSDVQADFNTREPCQYTQFYDYLGRVVTSSVPHPYVFGVCRMEHRH